MATEVKATVVQEPVQASPVLPISTETTGILGGGVLSLVAFILWLRRRTSRDALEIVKDRTEGQLLKTALEDRDRAFAEARQAWSELNAMQRASGQTLAENEYLKRELIVANEALAAVRRGVQGVGQTVDATKTRLDQVEKRTGNSGVVPLSKD